jgi:hypothetical protein
MMFVWDPFHVVDVLFFGLGATRSPAVGRPPIRATVVSPDDHCKVVAHMVSRFLNYYI